MRATRARNINSNNDSGAQSGCPPDRRSARTYALRECPCSGFDKHGHQRQLSGGIFNKYHYNFWRPETGIRAGDADGNPKTEADPNLPPFIATPCFPSYPSNHAGGTNGGIEVMLRGRREGLRWHTFSNRPGCEPPGDWLSEPRSTRTTCVACMMTTDRSARERLSIRVMRHGDCALRCTNGEPVIGPEPASGTCPTERFRQQRNGQNETSGSQRIALNKQGVSQPEFSLTTKLRHTRQNGT
jgi:hypothetical protein